MKIFDDFLLGRVSHFLNVFLILFFFQFANVNTISAQDDPEIKEGDRLRITAPKKNLTKQVVLFQGLHEDILNAKSEPNSQTVNYEIPLFDITNLEISLGEMKNWEKGLAIGGGVGLLLGIPMAASAELGCDSGNLIGGLLSQPKNDCPNSVGIVIGSTIIGGMIGILLSKKKERWREITITQLYRGFGLQGENLFGAGIAVKF